MKFKAIVLTSLCLLPRSAVAQVPDTVVEVLGLRRWSVKMVEDSLQHYAPGTSMATWACAVILRDSIGFAQAAVDEVQFPNRIYRTLSVVEPEDKKLLGPLALRDSLELNPDWRGIIAVLRANRHTFGNLQDPSFYLGNSNNALGRPADSASLALRDSVIAAARRTDIKIAIRAYTSDRNRDNRVAAAFVLGQYHSDARAWRALVKGLRGPSDNASSAGEMILNAISRAAPINVDWKPSETDLRYLLAGTNLFAYLNILNVLRVTEINPALGRKVARSGRELLAANLTSKSPVRRERALKFAKHIHSADLGDDPEKWAAWARSL